MNCMETRPNSEERKNPVVAPNHATGGWVPLQPAAILGGLDQLGFDTTGTPLNYLEVTYNLQHPEEQPTNSPTYPTGNYITYPTKLETKNHHRLKSAQIGKGIC